MYSNFFIISLQLRHKNELVNNASKTMLGGRNFENLKVDCDENSHQTAMCDQRI